MKPYRQQQPGDAIGRPQQQQPKQELREADFDLLFCTGTSMINYRNADSCQY
jgi:hypothetical protein